MGADLNYSVFRPGLQDLQSKAGVGQAEAEGIADPLRRALLSRFSGEGWDRIPVIPENKDYVWADESERGS